MAAYPVQAFSAMFTGLSPQLACAVLPLALDDELALALELELLLADPAQAESRSAAEAITPTAMYFL